MKICRFSVCIVLKRFTKLLGKGQPFQKKIEENLNIYLKHFALLYADDTVIMAESREAFSIQSCRSRYAPTPLSTLILQDFCKI